MHFQISDYLLLRAREQCGTPHTGTGARRGVRKQKGKVAAMACSASPFPVPDFHIAPGWQNWAKAACASLPTSGRYGARSPSLPFAVERQKLTARQQYSTTEPVTCCSGEVVVGRRRYVLGVQHNTY